MSMYYLNPETGKYELQGAPHVDAYSKEQTDAMIAAIPKGVEMELLWENASPTSKFTNQKISLNLDGFQAVLVKFKCNGYASMPTVTVWRGFKNQMISIAQFLWYRDISFTDNDGITISSLYSHESPSTNKTDYDQGYMQPIEIYGIKGVTINE